MRFYVLGQLEVATSSGPVLIRAKRMRALLAILLLNTTQVVAVDRIIEGVWPGQPPRSALENVRTYISQLRQLLGQTADLRRLESHPGGYRLRTGPEELDMLRFETLAADGRQALQAGDNAGATVLLGEAIDLWRGTPLPELELGPAIRAKTVALEEKRWQVLTDWITARLALGEHAELVATLRELIGERPLDERLWCRLITALYLMGRTGEALSAFGEVRELFVRELGIEPGTELRAVQAAVLGGKEIPAAAATGHTVLPRHSTPHQLPTRARAFVGRDEELRQVREAAARVDAAATQLPVVQVSGPPGVGKSATAVAAATSVSQLFLDGELYLDLRGSTSDPLDSAEAIGTLLGGLGIPPDAMPSGAERRAALYRSMLAERRVLVLLDDAADAGQVTSLLPGPGRSMVIVTSRRLLAGVESAAHLHLEPLSEAEALTMLGGIVGPDRVEADPTAATEIVRACGRLPAAIRIAGARLAARPQHSLRILAERLTVPEQLLDELSLDDELNVRRMFDVSYRTLPPRARECFRLLSLFDSGHITAGGLGELLSLTVRDADRELERLLHEGMLSPGTTGDGKPDYHMPTVLHIYAHERFAIEGPLLRPAAGGGVRHRGGQGRSSGRRCAASRARTEWTRKEEDT
jgi:DNA-binding SARP family transcriptional activator